MTNRDIAIVMVNSIGKGGGTDDQSLLLSRGLRQLGYSVELVAPPASWLWEEAERWGIPRKPAARTKGGLIGQLRRLASSTGARCILHAHHGRDYWPVVLAAHSLLPRPKIVLSRHLAKSPGSFASRLWLLSLVDAFVAVSRFTGQVLREGRMELASPEPERRFRPGMRGDAQKIRVILGGIDPQRFSPGEGSSFRKRWGIGPEEFLFVLVGNCDRPRGKGQLLLLEATRRLRASFPQARWRCALVGRGSLESILRDRVAQWGLKGQIILWPYEERIEEVYRAADCLVHPGGGTEAFGLVIVQAFACGIPVIAGRLDGIPEAFEIGQCGRLVDPDSVEDLAQAMAETMQKGRLAWEEKIRLHRRVASAFSYEKFAGEMADLYAELFRVGLRRS